jgi:heme A synthase
MKSQRSFVVFCWILLTYTVLVILWGAYVRATGSGAGCGNHWPLCDGQVIPRETTTEMIVEFSHRLSSGLAGLLALILLIWAFRAYPQGHPVRVGAVISMFFMLMEGTVGALLVRLELVAQNDSVLRAVMIAVHLLNTFLLLASITLTAWWATGGKPLQLRQQGKVGILLGIGLLGMLLLGASGAITALGDTLFPANSLVEGIQQDLSPTAHFLVRLRVWHPAIAIGMGVYLIWASTIISRLRPSPPTKALTYTIKVLFLLQLAGGFLNVYLLAPVWMQLIHLLLADMVWINLVLLAASALKQKPVRVSTDKVAPWLEIKST